VKDVRLSRWRSIISAGLLYVPALSLAWDGDITGVITMLDVNNVNNTSQTIYVSLSDVAMCGTSATVGYLNSTDSNYSAFAAALLSVKTTGGQVRVLTTHDAGGCHIGDIQLK
jgi:hypothetical protein